MDFRRSAVIRSKLSRTTLVLSLEKDYKNHHLLFFFEKLDKALREILANVC